MLLGSSDETLPMMCSRSLFEKSLYFPNGLGESIFLSNLPNFSIEISNQELNKLCKININDWITVVMKLQGDTNNQAVRIKINFEKQHEYGGSNGIVDTRLFIMTA